MIHNQRDPLLARNGIAELMLLNSPVSGELIAATRTKKYKRVYQIKNYNQMELQ